LQTINTDRLYSETKLFSQGTVADEFTFVAADARGPDGSINPSAGAEEQCLQTLQNLRGALNSVGQDLQNLVSVMVFLPNHSSADGVAAALQADLPTAQSSPAITLVGVCGLEGNCRVRMDAIATRNHNHIQPISLDDFPLATGARCHGVRVHDFVFLSGVDAADSQGKVPAPVTIQSQTKVVLNRIGTILGDQKLSLSDLCRTFMFMPNTEYRPGYGEARKGIYHGIFSEDEFPPNSGIYIRDLGPDILLRSVAVAYAGEKTIVASPKVRKAPGSFSQSVRVGDWLLMAGQDAVGFNRVVEAEGDLAGQTQVTLQHIQDIVEEAGGSLDDVVKTTVYLVAGQDRSTFSAAYQKFFEANKRHSSVPAGLTVEVRGLSPRCLIEIDAVALLRHEIPQRVRP
jgi:2-iminobutanoate/2-iminopropanoate deaminase